MKKNKNIKVLTDEIQICIKNNRYLKIRRMKKIRSYLLDKFEIDTKSENVQFYITLSGRERIEYEEDELIFYLKEKVFVLICHKDVCYDGSRIEETKYIFNDKLELQKKLQTEKNA